MKKVIPKMTAIQAGSPIETYATGLVIIMTFIEPTLAGLNPCDLYIPTLAGPDPRDLYKTHCSRSGSS